MLSPQAAAQVLTTSPVIVPTETVFGVTALATPQGVESLYTLKNRDPQKPFAVLAASLKHASSLISIPPAVHTALGHLWPGPLTFIGNAINTHLAQILGTQTIGVRVSSHPAIKGLLQHSTHPLALTSANISGALSITQASQMPKALSHLPCISSARQGLGIESTVVRFSKNTWQVLRLGATPLEALAHFYPVSYVFTPPSHPLCFLDAKPEQHTHFLGFGHMQKTSALNLSPKSCVHQACKSLYAMLHTLPHATRIGVAPIPAYDLGLSVRDTLARLMAPRDGLEPPTK